MKTNLFTVFFTTILLSGQIAQAESSPAEKLAIKPEFVERTLLKRKLGPQQSLQIVCSQSTVPPEFDVEIKVHHQNKKQKTIQKIYQNRTFNKCDQFKFTTATATQLVMAFPPGLRNDEPGSTVTITYSAKNMATGFVQNSQKTYSPFLDLKARYEKLLTAQQVTEAERLIIKERSKLEGGISSQMVQSTDVCEKFHRTYLELARALYNKKDYKKSFETLMLLKAKFGAPQNIFYDQKAKDSKLALVCETKNSNQDQSENHFETFAQQYMNKEEYIPFIMKRAFDLIKAKSTNEDVASLLDYTSQMIRKTNNENQAIHQPTLVQAWQTWTKNNPDHSDFDRLIDADNHLIMLLAQKNKCDKVPKAAIVRMNLAIDKKDTLEAMGTSLAEDYFNQGLINSALNEYVQFVQSRIVLKKCDKIPKIVFERYFKHIGERKVVDDTSL